jgi:O-antigen/teichoic acid export membrane protein
MLSVLAKLGSAAIVGQFALGLAIAAPVFMFTNLHLRVVQATDARSEYKFADYFTLRLIGTLFGLAVVSAFVFYLKSDWSTCCVIALVAVAKSAECLSDVIAGLLQKEERLDRVAVSLMIRGGCSLAVFGLLFGYFHSVVLAVAGMLCAWSAVLVFYDMRWASRFIVEDEGFLRFDRRTLKRLFVVSLPLGIVMTLISLNVNVPRYLLQHYLGSGELGIFASLAYLVVAVNLIVNALGQSASTRLSRMFAEGRLQDFRKLIGKLAMLGLLVLVAGVPMVMLVGRPALTMLYRPEYGDHVNVLAVMVAAAGLSTIGSFVGYGITAARKFREQVPLIVSSTVSAMLGSIILIPKMGLLGAALALLISATVFLVGACLILHSTFVSAANLNELCVSSTYLEN